LSGSFPGFEQGVAQSTGDELAVAGLGAAAVIGYPRSRLASSSAMISTLILETFYALSFKVTEFVTITSLIFEALIR
jgi:hypothetical protein